VRAGGSGYEHGHGQKQSREGMKSSPRALSRHGWTGFGNEILRRLFVRDQSLGKGGPVLVVVFRSGDWRLEGDGVSGVCRSVIRWVFTCQGIAHLPRRDGARGLGIGRTVKT